MKNDIIGGILLLLSIGVMVSVLILQYTTKPKERDEFNCLKEEGIQNKIIYVIDKTDNYSHEYKKKIRRLLINESGKIKENDLIAIYTIDGKKSFFESEPLFKRCSSGSGDEAHWFFESVRVKDSNHKRVFGDPLDEIFKSIIDDHVGAQSPIVESLEQISATYGKSETLVKVILISDMLQNSQRISSFYNYSQENFKYNESVLEGINIYNLDISAYVVFREKHATRQKVIIDSFWANLFSSKNITARFDYTYLH